MKYLKWFSYIMVVCIFMSCQSTESKTIENGEYSDAFNEEIDEEYAIPTPQADIIGGHRYVDLGLPSGLKWATANIGAYNELDYGDYFAWGEILPKETYTEENSKGIKGGIPNGISGNPKYDAAVANWGYGWRLPTIDEVQELIENTVGQFVERQSTYYYTLQSKTNGNVLIIPCAGCYTESGYSGTNPLYQEGIKFLYWTGEGNVPKSGYAWMVYKSAESEKLLPTSKKISFGFPIRPVHG